jgi:hypothetical protein
VITFTRKGWFSDSDDYKCEGVLERDKKPVEGLKVEGKWNSELFMTHNGATESVWQRNPNVANHRLYYFMSHFTLQLNYMPESMKGKLPPTDSRRRPDQRALEDGDL